MDLQTLANLSQIVGVAAVIATLALPRLASAVGVSVKAA
jgi:hypothetical protein